MAYEFYKQYMQSDEWKKKRRLIYIRDVYCKACNSGSNLGVHHKTYKRLGEEKLSDLVLLCKPCHFKCHDLFKADRSNSLHYWTELVIKAGGGVVMPVEKNNWQPSYYGKTIKSRRKAKKSKLKSIRKAQRQQLKRRLLSKQVVGSYEKRFGSFDEQWAKAASKKSIV
jgi:hypothetical protein